MISGHRGGTVLLSVIKCLAEHLTVAVSAAICLDHDGETLTVNATLRNDGNPHLASGAGFRGDDFLLIWDQVWQNMANGIARAQHSAMRPP